MRRRPPRGQVSGSLRWYRPGRLTPRRQYVLFFGLAGLVAVGSAALGRRGLGHPPADVLSAVPRGAWLVATVDVAGLRSSPVAQAFASAGGVSIPGVGRIVDVCGFEPLAHVTDVALVDPEGEGDFGVAFEGDFDEHVLSDCAQKIVRDRSGTPTTEKYGSYTLIGDGEPVGSPGVAPADAGKTVTKRARLAIRRGGPFLVGRGTWLETMIDAVEGKTERAAPELFALRSTLFASGGSGGGARQVVVSALLPKSMRDQLKSEMQSQDAPRPSEAYAGVLGVDRAGFAVATGAAGSTTYFRAELHCETAGDCGAVKGLLEQKRAEATARPEVRLLGLGQALDTMALAAAGTSLEARAELPTDTFVRLVERLAALSR